ncbi:hypothetical protein SADUNF_Sadunf10G0179900 [Salix dunnii]|uniref:Uncharacterized protein n=1 Tax=Salix dunnii TaxID=1413687 RepID=A0A835JPD4_9ROSI|nr:hypothetical protein SADUNF_Sadunf10G0179900 [Salix dunnii]
MSSDQELFQNLPELGLKVIIKADHDGEDDECCTPTSAQHEIPAFLTCPPAPKKPRRRSPGSRKRRLSNLHFFEVVNREEVDLFFRSNKKASWFRIWGGRLNQ